MLFSGFTQHIEPFTTQSIEQITDTGNIADVAMSPDGKTLAVVRSAVGEQALWIKNISTGRDLEILPPVPLTYGSLTFSRDANKLNFVREDKDNPSSFDLYSLPVFGGEPKLVFRGVERAVCLSPDEQHIAFTRVLEGASEVHIVTFSNAVDTVVYKAKSSLSPPAWSPNGQLLAWINSPDKTRQTITLFGLGSKKERDLMLPEGIQLDPPPTWMPSGGQLLLLFSRPYSGVRSPGNQIGLMSIDTGNFRQLTNDMTSHSELALSADGNTFATLIQQDSSEVGFYNGAGARLISSARVPRTQDSLTWFDENIILTSDPF